MQRDVGNEVIVAIMAVAVLAFALIFAIILSLSGGSGTAATVVDNPTVTVTENVADETEESSTATIAASDTAEPTEEATEASSATDTASPQPATDTDQPTEAPSATDTKEPTDRPSPTSTDEPTSEPSNTPRPSSTSRPSATSTPRPTNTPRPTLTDVPASATPIQAATSCVAPVGWRTYTVQSNDTLASVAAATGSSMTDMLTANCLTLAQELTVGSELYVPRLPGSGQNSQGSAPRPVGCTVPQVQITSPLSGQRVSGTFRLVGTANMTAFALYRIEVRPDFSQEYDLYEEFDEAVTNGELARVDSDAYGNGLHWVRLSVISTLDPNAAVTCAIPMFFD